MKEKILGLVEDLVTNFLDYDRRSDEDFPVGTIENAIENGLITIDEIIQHFGDCLGEKLNLE